MRRCGSLESRIRPVTVYDDVIQHLERSVTVFDKELARTRLALVLSVLASAVAWPALGAPRVEEAPIPDWFLEHVASMTEGSGRWIASNSEYRSEAEPFDAYGLEFERGLGGKSLRGRLFVLRDGEEAGTVWELRTVWHPGRREVLAHQFGADGTLGVGVMVRHGERSHRIEQEFFSPDGQEYRVGHENEVRDGRMEAKSFSIAPDGTWKPRRSYSWRREPEGGRSASDRLRRFPALLPGRAAPVLAADDNRGPLSCEPRPDGHPSGRRQALARTLVRCPPIIRPMGKARVRVLATRASSLSRGFP